MSCARLVSEHQVIKHVITDQRNTLSNDLKEFNNKIFSMYYACIKLQKLFIH